MHVRLIGGAAATEVHGPKAATARFARAVAHPNVALVKYWGKRDPQLNLPSVGSISLTLGGLETEVTVEPTKAGADEYWSNGHRVTGEPFRNISSFLRIFRDLFGLGEHLKVVSRSNFPVAAGLASSASTYAALTLALATYYRLDVSAQELSVLARRGSGSACRSLWGGFVEWYPGERPDGKDSYAAPLPWPASWPIAVVVAITDPQPKATASRSGMQRALTSPFFRAWVASQEEDLNEARQAIALGDLERLGTVAERNCLKMHAVALSGDPPLCYWRPGTIAAMETVRALRASGIPAYFTIDAGPQVKVLCARAHTSPVADALRGTPGVRQVLVSWPGDDARVLEVGQ
ncbi:MAG: diphosphomevalonate decarboxylase [Candidatus Binatia bacterium]|nr:MAG: diphosphomevalonate decarboxylase [Candidatus Binatia bacterium]